MQQSSVTKRQWTASEALLASSYFEHLKGWVSIFTEGAGVTGDGM